MEHCRFLEDGGIKDWYNDICSQNDRRKILAPFQVPDFLSNETSAKLNGYFGCETTFKSSPSDDELDTLSTSSNSAAS
jgi:hypothetical protein